MLPVHRRRLLQSLSALTGMACAGSGLSQPKPTPQTLLAPTPPMGWDSWQTFGTAITEPEVLESAQAMVNKLRPYGYDTLTIGDQWYRPDAAGFGYGDGTTLSLDGYGRLIPAANRFPSSQGAAGFAPLSDQLHANFLRFGLSLMRGIPRLAVERNLPILGTTYRAQDIADKANTCPWNKDMYGVDMRKPGSQDYYNSVFKLLADWGVDFVRMNDTSAPYTARFSEIEAVHKAIELCGRPIILSLESGETDLKWAAHAQNHAQAWRISDVVEDDWREFKDQFRRVKDWTPWRGPDSWPDAAPMPVGILGLGARQSRLNIHEQTSLMTLWAIARSPLFVGGDLRALDAPTLKLLTNEEVLRVNQHSTHNRARYMKNEGDAYHYWTAEAPNGGLYLGLFNLADQERFRYINLWEIDMKGKRDVRDLWAGAELGPVKDRFGIVLPPHGAGLFLIT